MVVPLSPNASCQASSSSSSQTSSSHSLAKVKLEKLRSFLEKLRYVLCTALPTWRVVMHHGRITHVKKNRAKRKWNESTNGTRISNVPRVEARTVKSQTGRTKDARLTSRVTSLWRCPPYVASTRTFDTFGVSNDKYIIRAINTHSPFCVTTKANRNTI